MKKRKSKKGNRVCKKNMKYIWRGRNNIKKGWRGNKVASRQGIKRGRGMEQGRQDDVEY